MRQLIQDDANGFRDIKEVNDFYFDIQYAPERDSLATKTNDDFKKYLLKIRRVDGGNFLSGMGQAQQESLYYFSFLFQNDIYLKLKDDQIPCAMVHFENSSNSKNESIFHLVFDVSGLKFQTDDRITIVLDSERLSNLPIQFNLKSTLPKIF